MKKKNRNKTKKYIFRILIFFGILLLILLSGLLSYLIVYNGKIYPNIFVAGTPLAGRTQGEALLLLSKNASPSSEITLTYQEQIYKIKSADIDLSYDFSKSANTAYEFARTGNIYSDLQNRVRLLFKPEKLGLVVNFDNEKLEKIISIISGQISIDAIEPSISKENGAIVVNAGLNGREVNQKELAAKIFQRLEADSNENITIPVDVIDNTLNETESLNYAARAEKYLGKSVSLKFEYDSIILQDTDIFKIIEPRGGYRDINISEVVDKTAKKFERDPQNPKFVFEGGRVTEFQPALDGIKIDKEELKNLLIGKLNELYSSDQKNIEIAVPVAKTLPEVTTDKVNNLGIKELIGRGTSTYYHSIPGRIHNVALAASRINGTLVAPGETFSFNQTLGDVSAFTGYQQAYIISEGKTILGDGGGVCQVSSTLFRAVLNAGLPITERQAHAYRVGYYEQNSPPGLDATVYSPSPDFKFTNDTGNYILIEVIADTKNYSLVFELYGTKDGRVSTISKPVVTNVSAPPPDVYQDDPTLSTGIVKQVDYKAWGAKVSFNYVVTKDGKEIINKTFISNYKPWAAVYLRGTGPVSQ